MRKDITEYLYKMAVPLDDGEFPEEMEPQAVAYNLRTAAKEIESLRALLEEAESVLRQAGCTITADKIADSVCRKVKK